MVEILARYRPLENGRLEWPVRKAATVLGVSKATAARALIELERNGWLSVTRVAGFGGRAKPATYLLAMFKDDVSGEPSSNSFENLPGESLRVQRGPQSHQRDKAVPPMRLNSFTEGTRQSLERDAQTAESRPSKISDALAKSSAFKALREIRKA